MFTRTFWRRAVERAVKSAAQLAGFVLLAGGTLASAMSVAGAPPDAFAVNWRAVAGAAIFGFVASIITSLGSDAFGPSNDPSVVS